MIRSRFSIHTGEVALLDVADKLRRFGFIDVIAGLEHVHATTFRWEDEPLKERLEAALGYVPSRYNEYDQRQVNPVGRKPRGKTLTVNNDDEDDGN